MSSLFPPSGVAPLSVSELTNEVKDLLVDRYPDGVWVTGEVSNLAKPSSGHYYFKLKDAGSQLNSVMYRGVALRLKFDLRDGMEVIARGRLAVYVPRGEYQLQVEELQPKGVGPLELAFRQLKEKLSLKGYFEPGRKKKLPMFPQRIVLVTSATGAAVRDMLEILTRRWPVAEVWVRPVPVQGDGASVKIAAAIDELNTLKGIDVMIVGRGGGSLEDLWAFNEEPVADAIHRSRIPVVSGVGHETDVTIADMVADVRALTPSEAAERVTTPPLSNVLAYFEETERRMKKALLAGVMQSRKRLDELAGRRCFRQPLERIHEHAQKLDDWGERLLRAAKNRLQRSRERLASLAACLETLSPLNVLGRGYSLTRRANETTVLRDASVVQTGDMMVTRLQRGEIVSRVETTRDEPQLMDERRHE